MGDLTKAQILAVDDKPRLEVEVPEWGGTVTIRSISGAEHRQLVREYQAANKGKRDLYDLQLRLIQQSVIDAETGDLLFEAGELEAIATRSASALNTVFQAAAGFNGLTDEQAEEIAGN